jgi:ABC-type glycerol-3-phosphate transport system permease component
MMFSLRGRVITYLALTVGAIIMLLPYYWLVVMASNTTDQIYTSSPTSGRSSSRSTSSAHW